MASNYTTGTINQPDAGSVGLAMAEKIRDDVVAHPAWELVEEFTASGGLARWYVFKCLAAQSGLSADFFVVMGRTLSNGELRFCICEGYEAGPHLMKFYPRYGSNSTVLFDALGRNTQTFTLGTALLGGNDPQYWDWDPSGTSTKWWLIVTEDSISVAFNGPANGYVHMGAYIPLTPSPIDLPIQIIGTSASQSSSYGGITRNPAVAGSNAMQYAHTFQKENVYLGFRGSLQYNDRLQGNQRPVAEVGMSMYTTSDYATQIGWALGKQKRIRVGQSYAPGFAFGDAYAMGGSLWVPYAPDHFWLWDTGVASS